MNPYDTASAPAAEQPNRVLGAEQYFTRVRWIRNSAGKALMEAEADFTRLNRRVVIIDSGSSPFRQPSRTRGIT